MSKSKPTGTKEWAKHSVNCWKGCEHGCLYCYARQTALRYKRIENGKEWSEATGPAGKLPILGKLYDGTVMFPTTHDITPENFDRCKTVLTILLEAGNNVLIVSKPHIEIIRDLCWYMAVRWKHQVLFRFSIGMLTEGLREYWEPGAPPIFERLTALKYAKEFGYRTSVSMEPLIEASKVDELVDTVEPYVTDSIWIGKANQLRARCNWLPVNGSGLFNEYALEVEAGQTDEKVRAIYERLKGNPLIRWKDSYKTVLGLETPPGTGMDI